MKRNSRCVMCGYDTRNVAVGPCPECSTPLLGEPDARDGVTFWNDGKSHFRSVIPVIVVPPLTLAALIAFLWDTLYDVGFTDPVWFFAAAGLFGGPLAFTAVHVAASALAASRGSRRFRGARTYVVIAVPFALDLALSVYWVWYTVVVFQASASV